MRALRVALGLLLILVGAVAWLPLDLFDVPHPFLISLIIFGAGIWVYQYNRHRR